MKKGVLYGNLLVLTTTLIYGINTPIMKTVMPEWIDAWALTTLRQGLTAILFWITSIFVPKEKIPLKHLFFIFLGSIFGLALNQIPYGLGLTISSPIDATIIRCFTPIVVIILSVLIFRKKISLRLIIAVFLGIAGATLIILFSGGGLSTGKIHLSGNLLVLLSVVSTSIYMVIIQPLAGKYNVINIVKWLFLFATLITLPFSYKHIAEAKIFTSEINWIVILKILYTCTIATYLGYYLNVKALKFISATKESLYSYLQPVITAIISVLIGIDKLSWIDPFSLALIFISFYLVYSKKNETTNKTFSTQHSG